jgi:NAD(P)-dependent dehydrogenase (short-subunit alcohol dehydrogenase family)
MTDEAKLENPTIESLDQCFTSDEIAICLRILQCVADSPKLVANDERFKGLVTKIYKTANRQLRNQIRQSTSRSDRLAIERTGIVAHRASSSPIHLPAANSSASMDDATPESSRLVRGKNCYICKAIYHELHHFYHLLCPTCGDKNFRKRSERTDLRGRFAIVTGARIKIGYQVALKLLRDGAHVLATTRFPHDAMARYQLEPDFADWENRLEIHGLELRNIPSLEAFAERCMTQIGALDILVHNAAQTVRRPQPFYAHLIEKEKLAQQHPRIHGAMSPMTVVDRSFDSRTLARLSDYFPVGQFDRDGQQIDARPSNSWRLRLGEVDTVEMLETYLVNAAAPFILTNQLLPLLRRSQHARKFVVNVSAMEGQFARESKTAYHPHTNMAKAALNMLTRTSASDLAKEGIYMTSVDTGWITDENPMPIAEQQRDVRGFYTPLDIIDGAARIYAPIVQGLDDANESDFGCFLKDYNPYPW